MLSEAWDSQQTNHGIDHEQKRSLEEQAGYESSDMEKMRVHNNNIWFRGTSGMPPNTIPTARNYDNYIYSGCQVAVTFTAQLVLLTQGIWSAVMACVYLSYNLIVLVRLFSGARTRADASLFGPNQDRAVLHGMGQPVIFWPDRVAVNRIAAACV